MTLDNDINRLSQGFSDCRRVLLAIGDETRLHIVLEMMKMGKCNGVRVGEITEKTNLSRPAVSHHLQILKDCGVLNVRKEGTKNYYYFDNKTAEFDKLRDTLNLAINILHKLPDRSEGSE